jgi:L-rhamnonate dehydratase
MPSRREFFASSIGAACLPAFAAAGPIRITSVKAAPFQLLGTSRFGQSNFKGDHDPARWRWFGPFSQLSGSILVQIKTDAGLVGYGLGGGGGAAVYIIENHLKDLLLGADARNVDLLWEQIFSSTSFYGRKGVAIQALSGIDLALWDIAGKSANKPVWELLGGAAKERVRAYFTGPDVDLGLKHGFTAFKQPVNVGPADGPDAMRAFAQRLIAIRRQIGPDALLMIDCLCRWNVEYTLRFAELAAEARLYFIEEPLLPDDLAGYERLCREVTGTKIASGEHEFTHYGFDILLRHKAAHYLQPDLTWSGGLTTGRRVADMARVHSIPVLPHRGGSVYGMQLVISHSNCPMAESFGTGEPGNELMGRMTAPFDKGHYLAPPGAGMGVEFPADLLRKHAPGLTT